VAAVAFAAWLIATPFAGIAEAAEAAKKPAVADTAAAKRTVFSVIPSSVVEAQTAATERAGHDLRPAPSPSGAVNGPLARVPDAEDSRKDDAQTRSILRTIRFKMGGFAFNLL
jgi:hypothetical protein